MGLGFKIQGDGWRGWVVKYLWGSGFGLCALRLGFRVSGLGLRVWDLEF